MLGLSNPIFSETSSYGHFGRAPNDNGCFKWETLNISDEFKNEFL
jgi:S-adenosylmethionine synthetase